MKVAIFTDGESVSAHLGRCPSFTILDIRNDKIIKGEKIQNPGLYPGCLPQFSHDMGVESVIAGGMGGRTALLFGQFGIQPIMGISGKIEDVITRLLNGTLKGGESLNKPGLGKGYGDKKTECDHEKNEQES